MEAHILVQGVSDPPVLADIQTPVFDLSANPSMTFVVIEKGMQSGEPAVMIMSTSHEGSLLLQTSLDKLMTAASTCASLAENRWGWKRPEGYFSLMPPTHEERKVLLEAIRKELEEWEQAQ